MFPVTVNRFPWYKAGRSVFAVRLMFLVKRVNGFGSHRSIFFVHSNCMHPPRTETSGWMPRPRDTGIFVREKALSSSFFIPRRIEFGNDLQHLRFQSKCFTVESNRKNDSNDILREKGSKRLFLSKLDPPTSVREPRSHPRDTKRKRERGSSDSLYLRS